MRREFRNAASAVVCVILLGIFTLAQASTSKDKNTKNEEHHSRMSKAAFWKHHKHQDKTAKTSPATSKKAQAQKTQSKSAQVKPVSAKKATGTKKQNQTHASKSSKPSGKSAVVAKTSKQPSNGQASSFKE